MGKNLHVSWPRLFAGSPRTVVASRSRMVGQLGFRFGECKGCSESPPGCKVSNPCSTNLRMNQKQQLSLENNESLSVQIIPTDLQDWLESLSATDIPVRFMATSHQDSAGALNGIAYSSSND